MERREPTHMSSTTRVSAISLFVEDLPGCKVFYREVFGAPLVHEDETSAAFQFGELVVNLLSAAAAGEIVAPGRVASPHGGSRFQLSLWVNDVDAVCAELTKRGVTILNGPIDRAWGMRTANFEDPSGNSWEVAARQERGPQADQ